MKKPNQMATMNNRNLAIDLPIKTNLGIYIQNPTNFGGYRPRMS